MEPRSIVIIVRSSDAPALQKLLVANAAVQVFADSESLHALDSILTRPPQLIILDPTFVTTARGAVLVARLRAEPHLAMIQVRVLAEDEDHLPAILGHPAMRSTPALVKGSLPLDHCGTRDARRIPSRGSVAAWVNGSLSQLIDVSITGAQLVVPTRLRPAQTVRVRLCEGSDEMRCSAVVAWAKVEPAGAAVQYRVGLAFVEPDLETLDALCTRCRTHAEPAL